MSKRVTIIIPCYNQGHYLAEALQSIAVANMELIDVLIVNDGSTNDETKSILNKLHQEGFTIINQENQGLGAARNAGIMASNTDYILPLDADNKIISSFIERAINILDHDLSYAVVFSNANYFGDKTGILKPGKFNLQRLMLGNYIDACAMIRRSAICQVGLYDKMRIMGYEDWDLWLKLAFNGYEFYYLNELGFEYRVRKDSMMKTVSNIPSSKFNAVAGQITSTRFPLLCIISQPIYSVTGNVKSSRYGLLPQPRSSAFPVANC